MKKILCLLLCLCMLLPLALSGCANEADVDVDSNVNTTRMAKTLSFWIITDKATTKEEEKAMAEAFNNFTETTYTTHVDFVFCTAEEYEAKLDAQFAYIDSKPNATAGKTSTTKNETYVDELGMTNLKYPDVGAYQMDIVLITGKTMLEKYAKAGRLKVMDSEINDTYRNILKYVYNDILDNSKIDLVGDGKAKNWYAVPSNHMVGQYTYMLVNKELAAKYYFTESDFADFNLASAGFGSGTAAAALIQEIADHEDLTKIAPIGETTENYPLAKFWSTTGNSVSSLATIMPQPSAEIGQGVTATNIFADAKFANYMQEIIYCRENGYFRTTQEDFGVSIINGDYSAYQQYTDDYYVVTLGYPRLEDNDIFNGMFAVTSYTTDVTRSMEIITALTCNEELHNILQFGVEGVHYDVEDGIVSRLPRGQHYVMNPQYTGNVLIGYLEKGTYDAASWDAVRKAYKEEMSDTEAGVVRDLGPWATAILQNKQSMPSVVCGADAYVDQVDRDAMKIMSTLSDAYFDRLYACKTQSEYDAYIAMITAEIGSSDYFKTLVTEWTNADGSYNMDSLNGALQKWWSDNFLPKT